MPTVAAPILYQAYPANTDGNYIFYLSLEYDSAIITVSDVDFQLQIDNQTNFASPNLRQYTKGSGGDVIAYQDGDFVKGWEVTLPWRDRDVEQVWYYRVRIYDAVYSSGWTAYKSITLRKDYSNEITTAMVDALSDENVYNKEAYSSNIAVLYKALGKELDRLKLEYQLTQDDNYIDFVRDSAIQNNFGKLVGLDKTATETNTEYRFRVRMIWDAYMLYPGTEQGINNVVKAFTGVDPLIIDNSDQYGWILGRHYLPDTDYPDLTPVTTLYSRRTKGYGWKLYVYNYWDFTLDEDQIEEFINSIKPSHTKVEIIYP